MRYAIIDSNTKEVLNVAEWDGVTEWNPPEGTELKQDDFAAKGDCWDDVKKEFTRPLSNIYSKDLFKS